MEMLNQKQKFIVIILIVIAIGVIVFYYISNTRNLYSFEDDMEIELDEDEKIKEEEEDDNMIIVHITGAVRSNGIVKVNRNARINDVIEAAGGITSDADLENVNLAYVVEDGQKIYIPSIEDEEEKRNSEIIEEGAGNVIIEGNQESKSNLIDINKANLESLKALPGIGESTALRILEYRETHGKFKTIDEIKNVSGIGDSKFNTIKAYICV